MTKAPEHGANEYSDAARREAARSGRNVCDILAEWREAAQRVGDSEAVRKIVAAEKYLGCRNRRNRRKRRK